MWPRLSGVSPTTRQHAGPLLARFVTRKQSRSIERQPNHRLGLEVWSARQGLRLLESLGRISCPDSQSKIAQCDDNIQRSICQASSPPAKLGFS